MDRNNSYRLIDYQEIVSDNNPICISFLQLAFTSVLGSTINGMNSIIRAKIFGLEVCKSQGYKTNSMIVRGNELFM